MNIIKKAIFIVDEPKKPKDRKLRGFVKKVEATAKAFDGWLNKYKYEGAHWKELTKEMKDFIRHLVDVKLPYLLGFTHQF